MSWGSKMPVSAFDNDTYEPEAYEKMGAGPDEKGDDDHEPDEEKVHEGHEAAAKEMMDAHDRSDHRAYAEALHAFVKMCK